MAQDSEQIWLGMTAFGFDHENIFIMLAPRPVCVLAVTYEFFRLKEQDQDLARIVLSTGASQFTFLKALSKEK